MLATSVTIPRASRGHSLMLALTAFRNVTIKAWKTALDICPAHPNLPD
jgi:hypothetical protein